MFPLKARNGGVLVRAGQTEAAVDLARITGLYPAGVICEIMNPDGTMSRVTELTNVSDRLGQLQRRLDDVLRRSVEAVTAHPTFQQEMRRIERTMRALEARVGRLRNGATDETDDSVPPPPPDVHGRAS